MKQLKGQRGLSLIEVTIMLLVLMLLTSVLAPSIFDFVNDAQWVKVKEDCEAIAISVTRLHRDVGANLFTDASGATTYPAYKLDLLYSDGKLPYVDTSVGKAEDISFGDTYVKNWYGTNTTPDPNRIDSCEDQLITNTKGPGGALIYAEPSVAPFGPYFNQGWRGAYLSPPCAADPWGHTYQVNTKWATMQFGSTLAGNNSTNVHCYDVFCISAGKDGIITTPFGPTSGIGGTNRHGDDWTTVIAPCDP